MNSLIEKAFIVGARATRETRWRAVPLAAWGAVLHVFLAGCVSRGDWHATPAIVPQSLAASRTLADATISSEAWPTDAWWSGYGDPQLNTLIDESFTGSPSLEIAQARLRAAQAEVTRAKGVRAPSTVVDAEVTRQRYPENGFIPPPYA